MKNKVNLARCALLGIVLAVCGITPLYPSLAAGSWSDKSFDEIQGLAQHGDARAERELCTRYAKALAAKQAADAWSPQYEMDDSE